MAPIPVPDHGTLAAQHAAKAQMASGWGQFNVAGNEAARAFNEAFQARASGQQIPERAWSTMSAAWQRRPVQPCSGYSCSWSPMMPGSGIRGADGPPGGMDSTLDAIAAQVAGDIDFDMDFDDLDEDEEEEYGILGLLAPPFIATTALTAAGAAAPAALLGAGKKGLARRIGRKSARAYKRLGSGKDAMAKKTVGRMVRLIDKLQSKASGWEPDEATEKLVIWHETGVLPDDQVEAVAVAAPGGAMQRPGFQRPAVDPQLMMQRRQRRQAMQQREQTLADREQRLARKERAMRSKDRRQDKRQDKRQDRRQDRRQEMRQDKRQDRRQDKRQEMRQDRRQDRRQEMRQDKRQDRRQDKRQEMRQDRRQDKRQDKRQNGLHGQQGPTRRGGLGGSQQGASQYRHGLDIGGGPMGGSQGQRGGGLSAGGRQGPGIGGGPMGGGQTQRGGGLSAGGRQGPGMSGGPMGGGQAQRGGGGQIRKGPESMGSLDEAIYAGVHEALYG
jgi:hypothetical protein